MEGFPPAVPPVPPVPPAESDPFPSLPGSPAPPVGIPEGSRLTAARTGTVIESEAIMERMDDTAEDTAEVIPEVFTFSFGRNASSFAV